MAVKVPIVSEFNAKGITQAEGALQKFGINGKVAMAGVAAAGLKTFNELDAGYDAIVVGTGATGKALDALKADADAVAASVPNSFADVGAAVAEVNTRFGVTGEELQVMSKRFLDLSRITGTDVTANIANVSRVFGDWSIETENQAATLDKLFAATQATGIGMDRLTTSVVQFGAPMRQLGFTLEESIALFGKFEKEGVNTEAVMSGLRMGLGRMAKAGEAPIETFQRIIDKINAAGSQGDANAIALEAFGQRAGPDMAAAIREGRFELDELVATLEGAEGALDTAVEETESFTDVLGRLRNKAMTEAAPAITGLAEDLESLLEVAERLKLVDVASELQSWGVGGGPLQFQRTLEKANELSTKAVFTLDEFTGSAADLRAELERIGATESDITSMLAAFSLRTGEWERQTGELTAAQRELYAAHFEARDAADAHTVALGEQSDAAQIISDEIDKARRNFERFGDDGVENMDDVGESAERASRKVSRAESAFAAFLGLISDRQAYRQAADAIDDYAERVAAAEEAQDGSAESAREYQQAVDRAFDDMASDVLGYVAGLDRVPDSLKTEFLATLNSGDVEAIEAALEHITRTRRLTIGLATTVVSDPNQVIRPGQIGIRHSGGIIGEPNTRTDEVITKLQKGEGVIDRDTMRRGVDSSGTSSGASFNITVNAGVGTDGADVGRQVVDAIRRFERSNGTGWRS